MLGREINGAALIDLADAIRATPDAVRTGIDRDSDLPEYAFIRRVRGDDIIVALTRDGFNRTVFPSRLDIYTRVRSDMVEVTERVRRLE